MDIGHTGDSVDMGTLRHRERDIGHTGDRDTGTPGTRTLGHGDTRDTGDMRDTETPGTGTLGTWGWGHRGQGQGAVVPVRGDSAVALQVQGGSQPRVSQLCDLRGGFSGPPLALETLRGPHARALSRALFLTPLLPLPLLRRRLRSHVLELRALDLALLRLGLEQLHPNELRAACYLRGLNPARLEPPE
ncbi:hypothetical protein AV530_014894 [Patagioenas fasciata monilis]|uniref:Letm1 RBD domain-containing protein n=1 Tax=Patagioenas fasciata monilis TaxID=372326 RepID=A0A1V4KRE6_PATFA|nr:hypothetical protein AV530_014894 [Patagioenas fasciata monilis]